MTAHTANTRIVVISDLHIGAPWGGYADVFMWDDEFEALIEVISRENRYTTIVINGDFIDFPQIHPELNIHERGCRYGATVAESRSRLNYVFSTHRRIFLALANFIARGGSVLILPGNHDVDFHWDDVWADMRAYVGVERGKGLEFVAAGRIAWDNVLIEHGNQLTRLDWFEYWDRPIVEAPSGELTLERPWGIALVDYVKAEMLRNGTLQMPAFSPARLAGVIRRMLCDDQRRSIQSLAMLVAYLLCEARPFCEQYLIETSFENTTTLAEFLSCAGVHLTINQFDLMARALALHLGVDHEELIVTLSTCIDQAPDDVTLSLASLHNVASVEQHARIVVRGHSHVVGESAIAGCHLLNPGCWIPRSVTNDGDIGHDINIIEIDMDQATATLKPLVQLL